MCPAHNRRPTDMHHAPKFRYHAVYSPSLTALTFLARQTYRLVSQVPDFPAISRTDYLQGSESNDNGRLSAALAAWAHARPNQLASQFFATGTSGEYNILMACPNEDMQNFTASSDTIGEDKWPISGRAGSDWPAWPALIEQAVGKDLKSTCTAELQQVTIVTDMPQPTTWTVTTAVWQSTQVVTLHTNVPSAVQAMVEPLQPISTEAAPLLGLTFLYGTLPCPEDVTTNEDFTTSCRTDLRFLTEQIISIDDVSDPSKIDSTAKSQISLATSTPAIARATSNDFNLKADNVYAVLGFTKNGRVSMYNPWGTATEDDSKNIGTGDSNAVLQRPEEGDDLHDANGAFTMDVLDFQKAFDQLAYVIFHEQDTADAPIRPAPTDPPTLPSDLPTNPASATSTSSTTSKPLSSETVEISLAGKHGGPFKPYSETSSTSAATAQVTAPVNPFSLDVDRLVSLIVKAATLTTTA